MTEARASLIHTLGHSNHPLARLLELLEQHGIATLVDVRSQPYSRWAPQYVRAALERGLAAAQIDYVYLGRELGGRLQSGVDHAGRALAPDFVGGIERLIALARHARAAILCAEEDPSRCHRRLLVTPALVAGGVGVLHIRGDGRVQHEEELARGGQLALFG